MWLTNHVDFMLKTPKLSAQEDLHKRIDKVASMKERLERFLPFNSNPGFLTKKMIIKQLTTHDAEDYRKIRLEALYNNPDSFGTMYNEEAIQTIDKFRDRISVDNNNFILGCYKDKQLIGIIAFYQELRIKVKHKAYIRSMYVQPEHRGEGIGKLLLNKLIEKAKTISDIEILLLDVVTNNISAKQLYFSFGFQIYGIEKMAYKLNNQYFDMDFMSLQIK